MKVVQDNWLLGYWLGLQNMASKLLKEEVKSPVLEKENEYIQQSDPLVFSLLIIMVWMDMFWNTKHIQYKGEHVLEGESAGQNYFNLLVFSS